MRKKPETLNELMKWYDEAIDELKLENEILQEENDNLKKMLNCQTQASNNSSEFIAQGKEKNLYPNEKKEIILDILKTAREKFIIDGTRRADVVDDILKNNPISDAPKRRARDFQVALKGYNSLDDSLRKKLNEMGLMIPVNIKNHHKATYYGDNRYKISFAATCSDGRGGDNIAKEIIRRFL
jgi:hypothetical protein